MSNYPLRCGYKRSPEIDISSAIRIYYVTCIASSAVVCGANESATRRSVTEETATSTPVRVLVAKPVFSKVTA